jgi:hypothetical protein
MREPRLVRRDKAVSNKRAPGRLYKGVVTRVRGDGRVYVKLPELGNVYGPIIPLNTYVENKLDVGDSVMCTFTDEYFTNIVILGTTKVKNIDFGLDTQNIDGGDPSSIYGGIVSINAGGV